MQATSEHDAEVPLSTGMLGMNQLLGVIARPPVHHAPQLPMFLHDDDVHAWLGTHALCTM
eukprot:1155008-Pelagomonas_calceolata.AAC.6